MSSSFALRLRFIGTGLMSVLWSGVFASQLFGLGTQGVVVVSSAVAFAFVCIIGAFEVQSREDKVEKTEAIPVTIVTGWLGAGKTTMIQHILRESHGKRILVVENEAGSIGVDHDLLVGKGDIGEEEVVLLQNGCVCCSVRADLSRVLKDQLRRNKRAKLRDAKQKAGGRTASMVASSLANSLLNFLEKKLLGPEPKTVEEKAKEEEEEKKKKEKEAAAQGGGTNSSGGTSSGDDDGRAFDAIIVETTGVAQVSPIIQLFFADYEVRKQTKLDAVITVVDARHVWTHMKVEDPQKRMGSARGSAMGKLVVNKAEGGREEVFQQIAYADRVVVNKADLVESSTSKRTVVTIQEESDSESNDDDDSEEGNDGDKEGKEKEEKAAVEQAAKEEEEKEEEAAASTPSTPWTPSGTGAAAGGGESSSSSGGGSGKAPTLEEVCLAVRSLNPRCEILKAVKGQVPVDQLLGVKAFDLKCQVIPPALMTSDSVAAKSSQKADEVKEALQHQGTSANKKQAAAAASDTAPPGDFSSSSSSSADAATSATAGSNGDGGIAGGGFGGSNVFHTNQFTRAHKSMVETFTLVHESDGRGGNEVDLDKFNAWLPQLLSEHGEKLYRLKGFLAVHKEKRRLVCQGVHMTFTGERGEAWKAGETRKSTLVFIGKAPLPRAVIAAAFFRCLTPTTTKK